ncbi:MAG TPA: four helix bundle protein [Gemmatimonadaceae bacterium]|jgi:four helix bundle protein|nr:four helix bundle protein [Gemmatimonadaceae bacterium]
MSSGLRELRVWQESVALAGDVIRAVRPGIRRETKVLSDSVLLTALAVGSNIADGFARPSAAEQRESYIAAKRALLRLETELAISRQAELVPAGAFTELCARTSQVTRLLTGYLVYLDRQIAERDAAHGAPTQPSPASSPGSSHARA